jgi:predicted transcriptional regulator
LRKVYSGEIGFFGSSDIVIEAAQHGLFPLIVCVENGIAGLIKRLEENEIQYTLIDIGLTEARENPKLKTVNKKINPR